MAAEIARNHGDKDDAPVTTRVASSSVDDDRARAVERKSSGVPHRRTDPSETLDPVRLRHKLLPFGTTRSLWDLAMLVLVLYTAVVLPFDLLVVPNDEQLPTVMEGIEGAVRAAGVDIYVPRS